MYPENDSKFEDSTIASVTRQNEGGWLISLGLFCFYVPPESPIEPKPGMTARLYGNGMGSPVRGLFLDGVKVFYRTESEYDEYCNEQMYGKDAAEWLSRWDEGKTVWTIEMGGLGPGYEQCIHITCAEVLRHLLAANYDIASWEVKEFAEKDRAKIDKALFANPVVNDLGLSGAQYGAAISIAVALYKKGPIEIMNDKAVKDRHIQVSKQFPRAA